MPYVYSLPTSASFTGKGLLGYTFGPLRQSDLDVYYIEVEKGHDVFMISKKITRTYYVLSGSGYFTTLSMANTAFALVYLWRFLLSVSIVIQGK